MKTAHALGLIGCIMLLAGTADAGVTTIRQTLDYTHNGEWAEPWFIPPEWIRDHSPYHRGMSESWGWTHDIRNRVPSDAKGIFSATLSIKTWDVNAGMENVIYVNGVRIGLLSETDAWTWGTSSYWDWGTSTFSLPISALDELWANGTLYVFMEIDSTYSGARVTLGSATLTVNYNVTGKGMPSRLSVHRFWSEALSSYLYTAREAEKEKLAKDPARAWVYQGVEYQALPAEFEPGSAPVYRFWSSVLGTHFYTIDPAKRDELIEQFSAVWIYEGEAFWAFPPNEHEQVPGTIPVYRFWSDSLRRHFYTINEAQKDKLIVENWDVWRYEGVAWYAYPYEPAQ